MAPTVYYGDFVHSISLTELEYLHHGLLCVSEHGIIEWVLRDVEGSLVQQRLADMGLTVEDVEMVELAEGEFICPGLVDTHTGSRQVFLSLLSRIGIDYRQVGLGTDCSGGYSLGILSAVRQASNVSKTLAFTPPLDDKKPLSIPTLFHMATLGGASLCRLQDRIGNFTPGKEFDALRILPKSPGMWVEEGERLESVFEKWLFTGDDRDLKSVWVRGTQVGGWSL
ncbi:hypothetical protein P7C73_g6112, partial [Tremellales sp. Uapishka_1]